MYRTLIVGAGKQGALCDIPGSGNERKVISHAKAFSLHGSFELVGFYDTNRKACQRAAEAWKCQAFKSLKEAFGTGVDVVSIATPDETHYEVLHEIIPHKPKFVLCEKPITTNLVDAQNIVAECNVWKIPLLVDYTRRFIPKLRAFREEVQTGEYGKYLYGWGVFNRGWLHTASHMLDFVVWVTGDTPGSFQIKEIEGTDYRVFQIHLFFEKLYWNMVSGETTPDPMFDLHMFHVVENIYRYLKEGEPLMCTGTDALNTLRACLYLKEA